MLLVGKDVGPFTVEKELGNGAMGTVYLARHEGGRHVALKFMSLSMGSNPKALERFERECEILKQLRHPNIVRLLAHGRYQKVPFYAMEYIEGESLDRVLEKRGKLPWEEVVALGKQLCGALKHAHETGIIHRDLKPSNLMLARDGTLKLTDFGIAKDLDLSQITSANCTVGTASYMSPEQCRGEPNLSHKCDLYALGVVFYELLTGRKPFLADNVMEMFMQHVKGKVERPSRHEITIPVWLDTLVCQLLEKKTEKRPFDAAAVATALDQIHEKMTALQSAGVDALTSRSVAHMGTNVSHADKDVARTILTGMGRVKKKKSKPLYERAWFKALGLGALILALGALLVVALMPPSADSLFDEAKVAMDSRDPVKVDNARDSGGIAKYLRYYGDRKDAQADQVRGWADQVDSERLERALVNRMRAGLPIEGKEEGQAQAAIRHEEAGEFNLAQTLWQEMRSRKESGPLYQRVAERHLRDLTAVEERLQALSRKVDLARGGQEFKPECEAESLAAEGHRYQQFGDQLLAYRRWQMARIKTEKDPEKRILFLLSARQAHDLKGKGPTGEEEEKKVRREAVTKALKDAEALAMANKPGEALLILREVQTLYAGHQELDDLIKMANAYAVQLVPR